MTPHGAKAIRAAIHRAFVWAVFSEENQQTTQSLSSSNFREKMSLSILAEGVPSPDDLQTLVELAIEHHGRKPEIGVVGLIDQASVDTIMANHGYGRVLGGSTLEYRLTGG